MKKHTASKSHRSTTSRKRFRVERRGGSTTTGNWQPLARAGFRVVGRGDSIAPESLHEKQMLLPELGNEAPGDHAWAVAKFSCEILAEHATIFTHLMPPEVCKAQRLEAIGFSERFRKLCDQLDAKGPPSSGEVRRFARDLCDEYRPFIDFKRDNHRAQVTGALQSLVWPSFFDHTAREAERWVDRLEEIGGGHVGLERKEVVPFWASIMDEHFRFLGHLFDPDEHALVRKAYQNSASFQAIRGVRHGSSMVLGQPRGAPTGEDPDMILGMANEVLEFTTDAARQIEAGKIKSIISPLLADHVRREAVWFVDEIKRLGQ